MRSEFDAKIAKAMTAVRRRHIIDRILAVVRHYKFEKTEERSDHIRCQGAAEMNIAGGVVRMQYHSYGQFHEFMQFEVTYGGKVMFQARYTHMENAFRDVDQRRVIHSARYSLEVQEYLPGMWMKALELKRLIRKDQQREKRAAQERELRERAQNAVTIREDDVSMRQRFGV